MGEWLRTGVIAGRQHHCPRCGSHQQPRVHCPTCIRHTANDERRHARQRVHARRPLRWQPNLCRHRHERCELSVPFAAHHRIGHRQQHWHTVLGRLHRRSAHAAQQQVQCRLLCVQFGPMQYRSRQHQRNEQRDECAVQSASHARSSHGHSGRQQQRSPHRRCAQRRQERQPHRVRGQQQHHVLLRRWKYAGGYERLQGQHVHRATKPRPLQPVAVHARACHLLSALHQPGHYHQRLHRLLAGLHPGAGLQHDEQQQPEGVAERH